MAPEVKIRVVALPFAGGNSLSYRPIQALLPPDIGWVTLELPGRGARRKEMLTADIHAMVDALWDDYATAASVPYVLFGHSMGTTLGYELLLRLQNTSTPVPSFGYFTGSAAPTVKNRAPLAHLSQAEFWEAIAAFQGMPAQLMDVPELRTYFEPVLRNDFAAIEAYKVSNAGAKVPGVKLHLRYGNRDRHSEAEVAQWQDHFELPVSVSRVEGDHFYITKQPSLVVEELVALTSQL